MPDRMMIEDQALEWVIRLRDPAFEDWDSFESWMSADPDHADAYHAMAIADEDMADLLATPEPAPILAPNVIPMTLRPRIARRAWMGGALAASIAAMVGYGLIESRPSLYQVTTEAGVRKTVTLADGSRIALNGGTQVTLDRKDPRHATLDRGEAVFTVVHDAANPFKVAVGDAMLVDVGTRFNVLRAEGTTAVQVSEGAVVYNPDREAVQLNAGHTLRANDGDTKLALGEVAPQAVAGWTEGRLFYDGQTMADVAADLARYSGQPVQATPDVAAQRFRGVLTLTEGEDITRLAPLLGVGIRRNGSGWMLVAPQP